MTHGHSGAFKFMLDDVKIVEVYPEDADVTTDLPNEINSFPLANMTELEKQQNISAIINCDFNTKDSCAYTVWNDDDKFRWVRLPRQAVSDLESSSPLTDSKFLFLYHIELYTVHVFIFLCRRSRKVFGKDLCNVPHYLPHVSCM